MTLAQLGAEVIRIDPVGGGPDLGRWPLAPSGTSLYWTALNKGKRSVTLNFREAEGEQSDLEAGMAKYLASEYCKEVVEDSLRIHGGYGNSQEYEIERLYRDAPMLLIGEGTAEIQKMIIGRRLLDRFKVGQK
jgi:alkylation response protein AidB-like acyl-CoA dehydrogenase